MCGVQLRETNKTLCNNKDKLKERIMAAFTNLNKETVRTACRRIQNCHRHEYIYIYIYSHIYSYV